MRYLLETSQDTLNVKAGSIGIRKAFETTGKIASDHDFGND